MLLVFAILFAVLSAALLVISLPPILGSDICLILSLHFLILFIIFFKLHFIQKKTKNLERENKEIKKLLESKTEAENEEES